jgi:hypothetical protein
MRESKSSAAVRGQLTKNRFRTATACFATDSRYKDHGIEPFYARLSRNVPSRCMASIPRITTANTMAPCVIIGERAAESLQSDHRF